MISLFAINEHNFLSVRSLSVRDSQKGYLDSATGILARGYAYRADRARVYGIASGNVAVGLALVKDMDEEPACYDLQQFMIDTRYQGIGIGTEALRLILGELAAERKYRGVEVCVNKEAAQAIHVYQKLGFVDTGYIDEEAPDCVNMMYYF